MRQSPTAVDAPRCRGARALVATRPANLTGARGAHHALLRRLTRALAYAKGPRDFSRFDQRAALQRLARARVVAARASASGFLRRLSAVAERGRPTRGQAFGERGGANQLSQPAHGLVFWEYQRATQARTGFAPLPATLSQ